MDFAQSELTLAIAATARDFAHQYIRPHLMEWDESQEFPLHIFKEMGKLGLMGVLVPEEFGGAGLGYLEYSAIIQEVAKVCGSIGLSLAAHNSLCTGHILNFGNETQKQKYFQNNKSMIEIFKMTLKNDGISRFYVGWKIYLVQYAIVAILSVNVLDKLEQKFKNTSK